MSADLLAQFKAARRVSTPLVAIRTPDPPALLGGLRASFNGDAPPLIAWNCVSGMSGLNDEGRKAVRMAAGDNPEVTTGNPVEALGACLKLPAKSCVFAIGLGRFLNPTTPMEWVTVQACANLRDAFKGDFRMLVMLGPDFTFPPELSGDVLVLDDPLPGREALAKIVTTIYQSAGVAEPATDVLESCVDALAGIPSFGAEQSAAMCLSRQGMDIGELWERKRKMVESTPGLAIWRGTEKFADLSGLDSIKTFLRSVLNGREKPRAILFLDEIEKMVGTGMDTSGVSQSLQEAFLSWTQNSKAVGIILLGVPGAGKSATAKACAGEAGVPCVQMSLSGMKASLVGESEQRMRTALKTVDAVAQGSVLMIATCNGIQALTPEMRARFRLGTFFYDLPDAPEREAMWQLYCRKYELPMTVERPDCNRWVGREIESCCEIAWRLQVTLLEAAKYIVPIAHSAHEQIDALRNMAANRFLSASYPGLYEITTASERARAIELA